MVPSEDPGRFALIVVRGLDKPANDLVGLRALVKRADIPAKAFSATRDNDDVINSGWLPCNKPANFKKVKTDPNQTANVSFRYYGQGELYQTDKSRCDLADINCGASYRNYFYPRSDQRPDLPMIAVASASSTGIGGGGSARAVFSVPLGGLGPMTIRDDFSYPDRNVPCTRTLSSPGSCSATGRSSGGTRSTPRTPR